MFKPSEFELTIWNNLEILENKVTKRDAQVTKLVWATWAPLEVILLKSAEIINPRQYTEQSVAMHNSIFWIRRSNYFGGTTSYLLCTPLEARRAGVLPR